MHIATWVVHAFRGAAAIALFTSCSSGNASETLPAGGDRPVSMSALRQTGGDNPGEVAFGTRFGGIQFSTKLLAPLDEKAVKLPGRLVYVSYLFHGAVTVFDFKGKSLGDIGPLAGPAGLFVDSSRHLWVAQEYWPNDHRFPQMPTVLEFKRGETRPSKTLLDPAGYAWDVTICPNGTVYVSNFQNISQGKGDIQVYAGGSTKPTGTLTYPEGFYNISVTCDAAGNVFSGMQSKDFTHGFVVEYPGGKQSGSTRIINNVLAYGIKPDNAGNLLVNNQPQSSVCEYTEAGRPTGKCVNTGGGYTYTLAVREDGKEILSANWPNSVTNSFSFPGGKLAQVYQGYNQPFGAAYDPGQDI